MTEDTFQQSDFKLQRLRSRAVYRLSSPVDTDFGDFVAEIETSLDQTPSGEEFHALRNLICFLRDSLTDIIAILSADAIWTKLHVENDFLLEMIPDNPSAEFLLGEAWCRRLLVSGIDRESLERLPNVESRIKVGTPYNQEDGCEMLIQDGSIVSLNERTIRRVNNAIEFTNAFSGKVYAPINAQIRTK